ncbi:AAA family ATPase [Geobacter sp. DSM 9736]|uniref:ATP-binding protein n=1 Tax=Geobacter sp. DSM 9736 TaxID=1277350 RepID=UPI000B4FE909|nr:AAA family ATPase [Geobacter sp. DSM 9736]SNB47344.1 CO dehydrogenase maturation factor [Geobacter sp. DSM 9736]
MCKPNKGFRLVITGKGGVGKTTLTACLGTALARDGINVLAVDEDPQMNLPFALGLGVEKGSKIVPLNMNGDYIEEKTGIRPGKSGWGAMFKLNPNVADVVERYGMRCRENLSLLVMGTVKQAGGGCLCAENVLLDSTIRHLALRRNEAILLDTQAGVEHFGRALAKGFHHCLVVSDISFNSLTVACHSAALARETGIERVSLVVNRVKEGGEEKLARFERETGRELAEQFDAIFMLPLESRFEELEPDVTRVMEMDGSDYAAGVAALAWRLNHGECGCGPAHHHPHETENRR